MKILILGGDGYLGWPTAIYLSQQGHDVTVVDSYFKRKASLEKDVPFLFPVPNLEERSRFWQKKSDKKIYVEIADATNYESLKQIVGCASPDSIIHYAEQPSAPYSMIGQAEAQFTVQNNLISTLNIIHAVRENVPECHIVKLGTMGEYGTPDIDIEEGWLDVEHKGRKGRFLFPRQAGSLYHTTKIQDTDLLWFYVRTWGLRVTDLMQGPVYGLFTEETGQDKNLTSHFCYDEIFGTVLNRFMVQAIADVPLTVYGKGGQTRGYLNIRDTLQCLQLAVENPADTGELRIFNQFTETFSVRDLAEKVQLAGTETGLDVNIECVPNPRIELEEHYYNPAHHGLLELGLKPNPLTTDVICEMLKFIQPHKSNIRADIIMPKTKWR